MNKTLQVIQPLFVLEVGDKLELSKDNKNYTSEYNEQFEQCDADGQDISSSYHSAFTISAQYANQLIKDGYLSPITNDEQKDHINVFDEIDSLIDKYNNELNNLDKEYKNMPLCAKLEKQTVLENLNTVLSHLKNLKK